MKIYYWSTKKSHADNSETMLDYLENHLPIDAICIMKDGSYAEILIGDVKYAVHASGNGDFNNHKVEFVKL